MATRLAVLDGLSAYWRKDKRGKSRKHGKVSPAQRKAFKKFKKAAKSCSVSVKRNPRKSYRACMAKKLRKKGRR